MGQQDRRDLTLAHMLLKGCEMGGIVRARIEDDAFTARPDDVAVRPAIGHRSGIRRSHPQDAFDAKPVGLAYRFRRHIASLSLSSSQRISHAQRLPAPSDGLGQRPIGKRSRSHFRPRNPKPVRSAIYKRRPHCL